MDFKSACDGLTDTQGSALNIIAVSKLDDDYKNRFLNKSNNYMYA